MLERPPLSPEAEDVVQLYTKHAVCLVELWSPRAGSRLHSVRSTPALQLWSVPLPSWGSCCLSPEGSRCHPGVSDAELQMSFFLPPILWWVKVRRYTALPTGFLKPGPSADKNLPFRMLTPSPFLQLALNYCFPWEPRSPRSLKPTVENQTSREF